MSVRPTSGKPARAWAVKAEHDLLPASFRPRISMNRLAKLKPYAVESRYPSPGKPETRQEALQALKTASGVRQEALRMLGVRKPQDLE